MNANTNKKCIFCLEEKPLTIEHVFPESIGGRLTIPFVCNDCNSKLGTAVDGKFQKVLPIELSRQTYGITGKKGRLPDVFSGDWIVEDPACPVKRVRNVDGKPEALPTVEITDVADGKKMSMVIPATMPPEQRRKMVEKAIRRLQLAVNPELKDSPDKLDKLVESMTSDSLSKATSHSIRPWLHQKRLAWSNEVVQEYLKIAYELAFCLYGYPYVTKADTARKLREAIFTGGQALQKVHCFIPADFPKECDPFPDRELFFWIGHGNAFVRLFGLGACIKVLEDDELSDYPPIDAYLSQMVSSHGPDVLMGCGCCLWGAKLIKRQPSRQSSQKDG